MLTQQKAAPSVHDKGNDYRMILLTKENMCVSFSYRFLLKVYILCTQIMRTVSNTVKSPDCKVV